MSTVVFPFRACLFALALAIAASPAEAQTLKPYKDDLFSYAKVLDQEDGGDDLTVDYQELRDINERDEIPERRVKRAYVSLGVKNEQVNETLDIGGRALDVTRVGPDRGASFSVIFIHGRSGDRRLGANDFSFGGNFNRLKNLAVANGGVYYAPSVRRGVFMESTVYSISYGGVIAKDSNDLDAVGTSLALASPQVNKGYGPEACY